MSCSPWNEADRAISVLVAGAAGAEFVEGDTPPKVTIVEYVEVALAFSPDGKERGFVNAVLDHMAREAKPESFA